MWQLVRTIMLLVYPIHYHIGWDAIVKLKNTAFFFFTLYPFWHSDWCGSGSQQLIEVCDDWCIDCRDSLQHRSRCKSRAPKKLLFPNTVGFGLIHLQFWTQVCRVDVVNFAHGLKNYFKKEKEWRNLIQWFSLLQEERDMEGISHQKTGTTTKSLTRDFGFLESN